MRQAECGAKKTVALGTKLYFSQFYSEALLARQCLPPLQFTVAHLPRGIFCEQFEGPCFIDIIA
jgi:hypothetical protein